MFVALIISLSMHPHIIPVTSDFLQPTTFLSGRSKVVGDRIYCTYNASYTAPWIIAPLSIVSKLSLFVSPQK